MTDQEFEEWAASLHIVGQQAFLPEEEAYVTALRRAELRRRRSPGYAARRRQYMRDYARARRARRRQAIPTE